MTRSVLIVTLPPTTGGVPAKTEILARFLRSSGYEVTVASYATLSEDLDLVVPSWRLLRGRRPATKVATCFGEFPWWRVGCYLPELEFSYYQPSRVWHELIQKFDRHIAVGGTILVSNLLNGSKVPHFVWCASTVDDDRRDRRAAMPWPRRFIDNGFIRPRQNRMERHLLRSESEFLCVSDYTRQTLGHNGGQLDHMRVVPVPVDTSVFSPPAKPNRGVIGFAGRVDDPRKNIGLLISAMRHLVDQDETLRLRLTGAPSTQVMTQIENLQMTEYVEWTGWLPQEDLPSFYRGLDVFVFPSHKEGLGISGLQAMACGVPVVSTRCGGPESYVRPEKTGVLVDSEPRAMADAIWGVVRDRIRRDNLGEGARSLMLERYSFARFEADIRQVWERTWGEAL